MKIGKRVVFRSGVAMVLFGTMGLVLLSVSNAATNSVAMEAESGALSGNSAVVADGGASAGKAVIFGAGTPPGPGKVVFNGDFETGDLSQWPGVQACPDGVTIVTSPVRKGKYAAKFTVADGDTDAKCAGVPTNNPRAQLVSPDLFRDGDEYYIGFSTLFPADFPKTSDWFQFAEIYGPPFGSSPPMEFDVVGDKLAFSRDKTHNYDTPWTSSQPFAKGVWQDIVMHVKFSTDPKAGFVEFWLNGAKQTFSDGSQRLYYDTLVDGVNWSPGGADGLFQNQYRSSQTPLGTVTLYHDEAKVGTTYDSVAP